MSSLEGQTLGNYRIETLLGTGGMGEVYRAVHVRLNRAAAIKVMHAYLAADPTFQARFLREAQSAAALSHPHIVEVFDFGEQDERAYLVMELVPDGSLRTLMRQRSAESGWSLALGLDLVTQAAEGLAYAHRRGMVHRDIKPDNLLLHHPASAGTGTSGEPIEHYDLKISDFGLARLAESGGDLTVTGMVVGTPAYMSPEQCQGEHLDARSDLYSLGVVLYEVATGSLPFRVKTLSEAVFKHVSASPPPPRQLRPDLPEALEEVILRCLAKQPDDRFASATELIRALHGALSDSEMATIVAMPGSEQPPRFSTPRAAATPAQTPASPAAPAEPASQENPSPQPIVPPPTPSEPASVPPASQAVPDAPSPTPTSPENSPPTPAPALPASSEPAAVAPPSPAGAEAQPTPAAAPAEVKTAPVLAALAHPSPPVPDDSNQAPAEGSSHAGSLAELSGVWNSVVERSGVLISGVTSSVTSSIEHMRPTVATATERTASWARRRPIWNWVLAGGVLVAVVVLVVALSARLQSPPRAALVAHSPTHSAARATATATVTPTPAATATPVETVKGNYPLTSPDSSWPEIPACRFANGGYTISGSWLCFAPGGKLGSATFSVRARQLSGPSDQFYGIVLRSSQGGRYYFFGVNARQQWTFALMGGGTTTIAAPTSDTHILAGLNANNTLTVRAQGSHFTFYVNGVQVGTADNTVLSLGTFGLTNAAGSVTSVYNDFVVSVPE